MISGVEMREERQSDLQTQQGYRQSVMLSIVFQLKEVTVPEGP